eukprot:Stramenopile-MAST_4_protein_434
MRAAFIVSLILAIAAIAASLEASETKQLHLADTSNEPPSTAVLGEAGDDEDDDEPFFTSLLNVRQNTGFLLRESTSTASGKKGRAAEQRKKATEKAAEQRKKATEKAAEQRKKAAEKTAEQRKKAAAERDRKRVAERDRKRIAEMARKKAPERAQKRVAERDRKRVAEHARKKAAAQAMKTADEDDDEADPKKSKTGKRIQEQIGKQNAEQSEKKTKEQAAKEVGWKAEHLEKKTKGQAAKEDEKKHQEKSAKAEEDKKVKHNDSGNEGCTKPVVFYSDCEFRNVVSKLMIRDGMTLEKVVGSPRGVFAAEGCRVSLYSKSSLTFSNKDPSQALLIKGDGVNRCLKDNKIDMVPVAVEIHHDIDESKLAREIKDMKSALQQMPMPTRRL